MSSTYLGLFSNNFNRIDVFKGKAIKHKPPSFSFLDEEGDNSAKLKKQTLVKRLTFVRQFDSHIKSRKGQELKDIIHDPKQLEAMLISCFESWKVQTPEGDIQTPKAAYLLSFSSNLKMWILSQTHHVIDISRLVFKQLQSNQKHLQMRCLHVCSTLLDELSALI